MDPEVNFGGVGHAVDYIYNFITLASSEEELDTIWIKSSRPFPIEISLRIIRDTIQEDGVVHPLCFNLAVRKISSDAAERSAGTNSIGRTHYFNLQFHKQARALRQTWLNQEQRTQALIDTVVLEPFPKYDVFDAPTIYLLPLALVDSSYGLFAVKMDIERTLVIDYSNQALFDFAEDFHDIELQREALLVKEEFNVILRQEAPHRNNLILEWPEQENIHVSHRRMDSGFKVLQEMANLYETMGYDMVHNMPRTEDPEQLRKRLMVQMLMVRENEENANIPEQVRAALKYISG